MMICLMVYLVVYLTVYLMDTSCFLIFFRTAWRIKRGSVAFNDIFNGIYLDVIVPDRFNGMFNWNILGYTGMY